MDAKQLRIPRSTIRSLICKGKLESQFIPAPSFSTVRRGEWDVMRKHSSDSYPSEIELTEGIRHEVQNHAVKWISIVD